MRKQHTLLNPIHRPGSAGGSIASAPGSNRKSHSVNEDLTPETPCGAVYSPFFSGLDFPLTQRPSSSLGSTSAGTAPRVREIHHHHHFYHYPDSPPINMPVANVMKRSEELKDGMRRLRKLSADAGLYTHTDAADDLMFAGRGERNGKRVVSGLSAKSSDSTFQDRDDFMSQLEK
ncbi:hypothetical protein BC830DRAFT_1173747 [Chytriomyces sp. MP71]|nr:hypothetical protein BC830DRAFT_1173747 [Chytriomyces sp. MP71]